MKISFDSALIWLIPYLYIVSVAYYWGYWGTFDVDVFNYYATSDLVKGITAPLGQTVLYVATLIVLVFSTDVAADKVVDFQSKLSARALKVFKIVKPILGIFGTVLIFYIIGTIENYMIGPFSKHHPALENGNLELVEVALFVLSVFLAFAIGRNSPALRKLRGRNLLWLLFFLLLPGRSFIKGKETALLAQTGKEFDYIIADSLSNSRKDIYKYLGKAGDYHFLLTLDNIKRIIVPASDLKPLVIEAFSLTDTASITRFKAHKKLLSATPKRDGLSSADSDKDSSQAAKKPDR